MAQRRMFSRRITETRKFKNMSNEAKLLFFQIGMVADDDGFVEGYDVCDACGLSEQYLHELSQNQFVVELNSDGLCWITVWEENNYIAKDRRKDSLYHHLLDELKSLYPMDEIFNPTIKSTNNSSIVRFN